MSKKNKRNLLLEKLQNIVYLPGMWENDELNEWWVGFGKNFQKKRTFKKEQEAFKFLNKYLINLKPNSKNKYTVRPVKFSFQEHYVHKD